MIFESVVCLPWGSPDGVAPDSGARHVLSGGGVPTTVTPLEWVLGRDNRPGRHDQRMAKKSSKTKKFSFDHQNGPADNDPDKLGLASPDLILCS